MAKEGHFWMDWRAEAFFRQMGSLGVPLDAPWRALEVGCGAGVLRRQVERRTAWRVDGAEVDREALALTEGVRGRSLLYDVLERRPELAGAYDAVLLFDTLEHIREPQPFLDAVRHHIRPGGWLFVNVPASERLRSGYDEVAGHLRRYDPTSLRRELGQAGLEAADIRYWGLSLVPLLILRALLPRPRRAEDVLRAGFVPPRPWLNTALRRWMRLETRCLARPPWGTSLLAAASRAG